MPRKPATGTVKVSATPKPAKPGAKLTDAQKRLEIVAPSETNAP